MRVLVTGASGFVGYAVAALLAERGHDVVGLTRSASSALPARVERVHGDLSAESLTAAMDGVDGVCHLAARTRVRESRSDPLGYWQTNVGGTLDLLHAMDAADTRRLVLASTCGVYGDQASQPINEKLASAACASSPSAPHGARPFRGPPGARLRSALRVPGDNDIPWPCFDRLDFVRGMGCLDPHKQHHLAPLPC